MLPLDDSKTVADSATPSESCAASPLSASQIALLVRTVTQALARGQSVTLMSDGRMLARYLPARAGEAVDRGDAEPDEADATAAK